MRVKKEFSLYTAEFIGTYFLVFFGCGSMVLSELGNSSIGGFIPFVWGAVVSVMIYS